MHIEHPVPDYDNRKKMGVRNFRILRPVDNPNNVIIDLTFDTVQQANPLLAAMREVWKIVVGKIMTDPQVQISEIVQNTTI